MSKQSATEVASAFLDVIWGDTVPETGEILRAIDRLLSAAHDVPAGDISERDQDPFKQDYPATYQSLVNRFPSYGYYPIANPAGSIDDQALMGDAIDDLADITHDLRDVLWLDEHVGIDDANWMFWLLQFHWGQHARDLGRYLHGLINQAKIQPES
jgi:hypothetical protein